MTKIYKKLVTAFWFGLAAFSACAFEHGLMRIPDSFAPRREVVVDGEGYENAVSIPLPGDGSMMLQNEMGGGVLSSPIPVHAVEAVEAFLEKFPKGKAIAAEVSGTTWFAQVLDEAGFISFYGPIVVKGYCFVLYLRTPANRGLDATVRGMLRQITLLPPEDGNSEPTIPLVKMDLVKVPPVDDIPNWHDLAKAHKREVAKASASEIQLPPLPAVVAAPKAPTVKPLVSDDFMNAATRKAAIAHVRESLRELVGPMSDEANAAFEKRWNAVADYPAPEILDWLKKASPIISEQVRLKAAIDTAMVACDDALREAAYAQAFGDAAAEREQIRAYAESLTVMKTAQARMNALQKELDALGEMPDPDKLRNGRSIRRRQARATVDEVVLGKKKANVNDGKEDYFVLTRVYSKAGAFQSQVKDPVANLSWPSKYAFMSPYFELAKQSESSAARRTMKSDSKYQRIADPTKDSNRLDGTRSGIGRPVGSIVEYESKVADFFAEGRLVWHVTDGGGRELDRRGASYRISWGVPTTVVHAKADTTFSGLGDSIAKAVKKMKQKNGKTPEPQKVVKKREPQESDGKVEIVLRVDGEVQRASLEGRLPKGDRVNATFGLGAFGRLGVHAIHKDKGTDAKRTVDLGGADSGRDIKLVADWGEGENGPRTLSLDLGTVFAGESAGLMNKTVYFEYEARKMTPDEAATEANILDAKFREIVKGGPHAGSVPGELTADDDFPEVEDASDTPEAKEERIAFHRQNIAFIEGTIVRLQKELTSEKEPSRRAALEWQIVCERSNIVYEQDRIRAEETGTFYASRTPFDEMCQIQQRENTLRQIQESERLNRARRRVEFLMGKMPVAEWDATDRIMDKINAEDPLDADRWIRLGDALEKKYMGRLESAQGMAESDVADSEERLRRATTLKKGCDLLLVMGGVGGAPRALSLAYQLGTGFADNGMKGAAKNAICFYSDAVDIAWSAYDGYQENGWEGALKEAAWSALLNKGVPFLMGKVQNKLNTDVRELVGGKVKSAPKVSADMKAYEAEVQKAKGEISEYIKAQNAFNQADLSHMTDRQLTKLKSDLTVATARVNANPTAKACLKYDAAYQKVGAAFDGTLGKIHETVKTKFYADMKAKGFSDQEIMQFRNASSKGTVGMDADWGLKETPGMTITRNGKRVSVREWQREATESWNRLYKQGTGFDAQKSWENITTHQHAEAYRNMAVLKYSKDANNKDEILSQLSRSDAQQVMDVMRFKADEMLAGKDFPRLVYVREAVRGTAKDMKTKLLPAIDARIKPLKAKQAALKKGETLSKTDAHNLKRLAAAKQHYETVMKTFDDIGTGKMRSEDWDDAIRTVTGGRGVSDEINDMADLFKSLVL